MPPRYVINSLTRQTLDTTVKFAANISVPCATVETADAFADLAAVPGNPQSAGVKLEAQTANVALVVGGVTLGLGERFFLVFTAANQPSGGVYQLDRLAGVGVTWRAIRSGDFNSDQAIVLGSHIYAINQGDYAGQFVALENKSQIVLETTAIEANIVGAQPTNQAVGTDYVTETGQVFNIAGTTTDYPLPQLQSGYRRRVEVDIYGSNAGVHDKLFLQQSNLVAVHFYANSIGATADNDPVFSFFDGATFGSLAVTYFPGVGGVDSVRIVSDVGLTTNLECTVQITAWDTPIA